MTEILTEILNSDYVKGFVQDVFSCIEKGVLALDEQPYGFGKGCYYNTPRELLIDAVYQFFEQPIDEYKAAPTLLKWVTREAKEWLHYEVDEIKPDNLADYVLTENVEVSTNLDRILEKAEESTLAALKEMSDTQIDVVISKIRGAK